MMFFSLLVRRIGIGKAFCSGGPVIPTEKSTSAWRNVQARLADVPRAQAAVGLLDVLGERGGRLVLVDLRRRGAPLRARDRRLARALLAPLGYSGVEVLTVPGLRP